MTHGNEVNGTGHLIFTFRWLFSHLAIYRKGAEAIRGALFFDKKGSVANKPHIRSSMLLDWPNSMPARMMSATPKPYWICFRMCLVRSNKSDTQIQLAHDLPTRIKGAQ